jgi:hypothetical protein
MKKLFFFRINLKRPRSWREDAFNAAEFDAWSAAQRRKYGLFGGLTWFERRFSAPNKAKRWLIASRHWPHLSCWSWFAEWGWKNDRSFYRCFRFYIDLEHRRVSFEIFGPFVDVVWQGYEYMPAYPDRLDAPKIQWKRVLEQATPMGHA